MFLYAIMRAHYTLDMSCVFYTHISIKPCTLCYLYPIYAILYVIQVCASTRSSVGATRTRWAGTGTGVLGRISGMRLTSMLSKV